MLPAGAVWYMPLYRIYFVDADAHITRPPEIIEAASDQDACEKARQFVDGKAIEVWREDLLVVKYPAE